MPPSLPAEMQEIAAVVAVEFDSEYYLGVYGDVRDAGVNPLHHFVSYGWKEGRDPNRSFSTTTYLDLHNDVREAGVNPFWHYLVAGRAEGRATVIRRSLNEQAVIAAKSIRQREASVNPSGVATLQAPALASLIESVVGHLIISISHDNYKRNVGGVQSCIKMEEQATLDVGTNYLHLFPTTHRAWLAPSSERLILGVTLNGEYAGTVEAADLLSELGTARCSSQLVVHSLLGLQPEWVVALSKLCTESAPLFWTHDYTAVCPSYALQRNDVVSCDGPSLSSRQCSLCAYGEERGSHVDRVVSMLRQINPVVVSPSEFSRMYFAERVPGDFDAAVVEHCVLTDKRKATPKDGAVRVAFVGTAARHKGWRQFVELVDRFGDTGEYEFLVFGPASTELAGVVAHHAVSVTQQGNKAMIEALRREDVDLAFLWSTWQETFCLTAYEAVASGAFVVTNPGSGNVARLVTKEARGSIFDDFADVSAAFSDGRIAELAARRRDDAWTFDLEFSRMSLDLGRAEVAAA